MKVSDFLEDAILDYVLIKIPEEMLQKFKDHAGGTEKMYFAGAGFGDVFMSPNPPSDDKRQLYPFPPGVKPSDLLECEVID
jgi:hypothetical protein